MSAKTWVAYLCAENDGTFGRIDAAMVSHRDHETVDDTWNFAHYTVGCHEAGLRTTAANGRIYCFATN